MSIIKYKRFYTCRFDRPFKEVFLNPKNKDLLKALLELVLEIKIDRIEIRSTELLSGNIGVKDKRVDALVYAGDKKIEIEINSENRDYVRPRNMAYLCNIYQSHTLRGEEYNEDTDIIQINFTYGLGEKKEAKREYKVRDKEGKEYVKNFKIYEINMDYYKKIWYDKNEDEIEKNKYIVMLDLDKEELEKMPKDKIVDKYITNVTIVNDNPEFQEYMSKEEDERKIKNSLLTEAREEGINLGIEKGINSRNTEIAKNLILMNMKVEDISKATGLKIEEINALREDI